MIDAETWAFVLAQTLGSAPAGVVPVGKAGRAVRWQGLDLLSLRQAVRDADLGHFDDDELAEFVSSITPNCAPISAAKLGEMLQLSAAERETLDIRHIDACDETKAERQERRERDKRKADAERKRESRALASAQKPQPLSVTTPWIAEGISEAAYRKRLQRKGVSKKASANPSEGMSKKPSAFCSDAMSKKASPHLLPVRVDGRGFGHSESDAPAACVWQSKSVTSISACGGFGVEVRMPIAASPEAGSPSTGDWLSDASRTPKSGAEKKKTLRPGRTVQVENWRERMLLAVFGDRNLAAYIVEELGEGHSDIGLEYAATLGRARLERLRDRIDVVGVLNDAADIAIAEARALAVQIRARKDVRHAENA